MRRTKVDQERSRFWIIVSRIGRIFTLIGAVFGVVTQWPKIAEVVGLAPAATPTPTPLLSVVRPIPGRNEVDSRITWTAVKAQSSCNSSEMILQKLQSWDGQSNAGYAELRFTIQNQAFPATYSLAVTISNLSDPVVGANAGGCAALIVHSTADGTTFETLNVCGDGTFAIVQI